MAHEVNWYCTCGDGMHFTVSPASEVTRLRAVWDGLHSGEGHAPTDQATAAKARRRAAPGGPIDG
jgi:hypothetical protein